MLATLGGTMAASLAGCSGSGDSEDESTGDEETSEMSGEKRDGGTEEKAMAQVQVAHFSPDAPNVDIYADGTKVLSDVSFRSVSKYLSVPAGTRTFKITAAGDPSTVAFEGDVTVEANMEYTIAATGELQSEDTAFEPLVLVDDTSEIGSETARIRVAHVSPDAPAVDITTAADGSALIDGAAFGDAASVEVPAGEYTLQIRGDTDSNDGEIVDTYTVALNGGTVYTAFAGGYLTPDDETADKPFDLTLTTDAGEGGGGLIETANVRVAHMSPDAPNVDVYVDGSTVLSDVSFRAVGKYLSVPAGDRQIKLTAAGDPSTVALDQQLTIEGETDYTLAAIGELQSEETAFQPLVLQDDRSDPGEAARVRLVHASPDAPAVDVTLASNGKAIVDGAAFGDSSSRSVPAGEYTLQIRADTEANDGKIVGEFDVALDSGTAYTIFAAGYLSPDDESVDEPFDLTIATDASYGSSGRE
jgi:hypothetical protein